MSVQQRRNYDPDFKRNAVQLTEEPGRTVAGVAENLGISKDLLYRWRRAQHVNKELAFLKDTRQKAMALFDRVNRDRPPVEVIQQCLEIL